MSLSVACVLRSGGDYRPEHVAAFAAGVRRHLTLPHRIVCLTDTPREIEASGVEAIRLPNDWPGWWSKLCLFKPGVFGGPVFFSDLDVIIVGPLDDLVTGHRFTVLENFWSAERIGSGLMAWNTDEVDLSPIYKRFVLAPERAMRDYVTTEKWGDQGWIKFNTPVRPVLWQRARPGRVLSYKRHIVPADGVVPPEASVICFHGAPRPWQTPLWKAGNLVVS